MYHYYTRVLEKCQRIFPFSLIIKNFTYVYNEDKDGWRLRPAYDLTYSSTYYGEHTTTVNGNGRNPEPPRAKFNLKCDGSAPVWDI